jgi:hypothetical protein
MPAAHVRFYEELNEFLPVRLRKKDCRSEGAGRRSVKDLIESFGVPHTEVDLILANGRAVDFSYIVCEGDRISVYPVFESLELKGFTRLRPQPLRTPAFVCDVHLGKLARLLRLLGFDTAFREGQGDQELAAWAEQQQRILLSRDRRLLTRRDVSRAILIRDTDPLCQARQVLERLDLAQQCRPFSRCMVCNGLLQSVDPGSEIFNAVLLRVPPGVRAWCTAYWLCSICSRVYWQGSHFIKMRALADQLRKSWAQP